MTTFTINITNLEHLAGIAAAREAKNATLSATPASGTEGKEGYVPAKTVEQHEDYLATDQDYVQFVMSRAAESYAKQHN